MPLEDDPLLVLGRSYSECRGSIGGSEPQGVTDDPTDEQPVYAEGPDGRWECALDGEGRIESIFLFGEKGCSFPAGLSLGMSASQVQAAVGEAPTRSKPERTVPGLGWAGAFMRWDNDTYSLHAEFGRDGGLIQLTYMVSKRAP